MLRSRRAGFVALGTAAAIGVLAGIGYGLGWRTRAGHVAENVRLAGYGIGGYDRARLETTVRDIASKYGSTAVILDDGHRHLQTTASALGVSIDVPATISRAMNAAKPTSAPARFISWMTSLFHRVRSPLRFAIDRTKAQAEIVRLDNGASVVPTEPTIAIEKDHFVAVPGKPGKGIDSAAMVSTFPRAAARGGPVVLAVARGAVKPHFSLSDATRLADTATELTRNGIKVQAGSKSTTVETAMLRKWLAARPTSEHLTLAIDPVRMSADLSELLAGAGTPAVDAGFTLTSSGVQVVPSKIGTTCCVQQDSADRILQALNNRNPGPVSLSLRPEQPHRNDVQAQALGIKQVVGSFTTHHPCCAPRVHNIHLIADAVRGVVIEPGQVFSVNGYVGKRTAEKGYVSAPVIYDGTDAEDIGGGVSQFATTLFNASFFAGLDYAEYENHAFYISRYPYGREATISYPKPDLKIRNTTPYGILIWTSYDDTSVTVTLYSTRYFADVVQSNQTESPLGSCTVVTTERTRTYLDGKVKVDSVGATYQAADGVGCDQPWPTTTTTPRPGPAAPPPSPTTTTKP